MPCRREPFYCAARAWYLERKPVLASLYQIQRIHRRHWPVWYQYRRLPHLNGYSYYPTGWLFNLVFVHQGSLGYLYANEWISGKSKLLQSVLLIMGRMLVIELGNDYRWPAYRINHLPAVFVLW